VLVGSLLGAKFLVRAKTNIMRIVFAAVISILGLEMIYNGIAGRI
jgi:uncharacterized membrane protein YfcA